MKLYFSIIYLIFSLENACSKVLVVYPPNNEMRKELIKKSLEKALGIPGLLIEYEEGSECKKNQRYDIVICFTTKNGELLFPTLKKNLVKKKYEFFIKN